MGLEYALLLVGSLIAVFSIAAGIISIWLAVKYHKFNRKENSLDNLQWLSLADNVKEAHARRKKQ